MGNVVCSSSATDNARRLVEKLGLPAARIPLLLKDESLRVADGYVLIVSTYGGGNIKGAVPKRVIRSFNDPDNQVLYRGVISSGNINFDKAYCVAGDIIAVKLGVSHMYKFELLGTSEDVSRIHEGPEQF